MISRQMATTNGPTVATGEAGAGDHGIPTPISEAQRAVLYALRRRGEATTEQLAHALGMSVSGARQHLAGLEADGLVSSSIAPREVARRGRPQRVHRVTARAEPLFPKAYGELTNQLLGYLPPDNVAAAFEHRRDERIAAARVRLARKKTFAARVKELAAILDEDGYLASFEPAGRDRFLVIEHNCAVLAVAQQHPHACSSEIEFIRAALPDAVVERTTHIVAGEHACTYEITRRDDA
jgi:predicted ArsR family transcriptional regulator